jgi:hypothetical protein
MPYDLAAKRKEAERSGLLGSGDYLKLKEGANRLRLLTECLPYLGSYQGKRNFKWLCYVVDRVDGRVKPFFMPHMIYKQIEALQVSDDYAFIDVPMPYDLTVNAKGAGTKEVEYTLMPARKESPITALEFQALADAKPLHDLKKALDEKATGVSAATPPPPTDEDRAGTITDNDPIPF